ncbi:LytTR family DNA-binding domain-containing protein [[Clostridium] innocuum]|uniref:LytTR family DNA-binding domain-containing protein n=1 Tax=Clostridium innocuum TaxID=1522 RepID=UPI000D6D1AC3|nr:LytTR family DNA-binding domain-containing protein [[Clostridium] innocuum]PWJ19753.1 LytTR family transcriptional regulator [[Clostridium] innocuum]SSA37475.1 transcriptional regulator, LytTR family [[Clostridium] innocuum]
MIKKKIEECIALTDKILTDHYHANSDVLKAHIGEECLWIGSCNSEYHMGKDEVIAVLDQWRGDLPMIDLIWKEFKCVTHDRNSCTISGRYVGVTKVESEEVFSDRQRVTFCWKIHRDELKIMHMHISNPLQNLQEGEVFPHGIGRYTKKYMKRLIDMEMKRMGTIFVKDNIGISHKILIGKIIYLEAFDKETLIHTTEGDIYAKLQMSNLEEIVDKGYSGMIIRVHKSFCANKFYVESIQRYKLNLYGGYAIPVSRNHYKKIKELLQLEETNDDAEK